jgi:hypothetical protein
VSLSRRIGIRSDDLIKSGARHLVPNRSYFDVPTGLWETTACNWRTSVGRQGNRTGVIVRQTFPHEP